MRVLAWSLLVALLALPAGSGQGHEHGAVGPTLIAHDGPPDGRQVVGNLAHFAAIARGDDAVPDFHQDVPMRVTLDGAVLFETTPSSGHDYDGVNVVDVVFPAPGPYKVEALDETGAAIATFTGEVVAAEGIDAVVARPAMEESPTLGVPTTFTFWVAPAGDEAGLVDHTDCWFEVLRGGATEFRTKTHTHTERQSLTYAFQAVGEHRVQVTCFQAYPTAKATVFAPLAQAWDVDVAPAGAVGAGAPAAPAAPTPPPAAQNAVVQGAPGGELLLVGTFDPYTVVGTNTLQHLSVLAVDPATGVPRQHVDFEATLVGPGGAVLFSSQTLHEYDGIYELASRQATPGLYTLQVTADAGDWSDGIAMAWSVAPPVAPTSAGAVTYGLTSAERHAGEAGGYEFAAMATSGPFAHSETELQVFGDGAVPLLRAKLHTHDDGTFPFRLALPEGGHRFAFDTFPLLPEAVLAQPVDYTVDVGPAATADEAPDDPSNDAPAAGVGALAGLLAALALLVRRHRALPPP